MGELIRCTAFQRNAIGANPLESAKRAALIIRTVHAIDRGEIDEFATKAAQEQFNDTRLALGVVDGALSLPIVTELGNTFMAHFEINPEAAWQWLLIRAGWATYFPNGSHSGISKTAESLGMQINLFDTLLRTLWHLQTKSHDESAIGIDEILAVLMEDENWEWNHYGLTGQIIENRRSGFPEIPGATLLEKEKSLDVPRDSLNTFFGKVLPQTGLIVLERSADSTIRHWQFRLNPRLWSDNHLRSMLLHVVHHPLGVTK